MPLCLVPIAISLPLLPGLALFCRWLQDQLPPEVAQRCYFFNTFFFKKLTEKSGECAGGRMGGHAGRRGVGMGGAGVRVYAMEAHECHW